MIRKVKGLYVFMGVNGVGKSTLTRDIVYAYPDASRIHASQELRSLFEGFSENELEQLAPEEKLCRKVARLVDLFRQARQTSGLVLVDTHLLLPVREGEDVTYMNLWSDEYTQCISGAYMLTASPNEIRARREADEAETGRVRDLSEANIKYDQDININAFTELIDRGALPASSRVVENGTGLRHFVGASILSSILSIE